MPVRFFLCRPQRESVKVFMSNISIPLYVQVKNDILEQIESNVLQVGDKLPIEKQLTDSFHVSRTTVVKALNELKAEGILASTPGQGTFVQKKRSNSNTNAKSAVYPPGK